MKVYIVYTGTDNEDGYAGDEISEVYDNVESAEFHAEAVWLGRYQVMDIKKDVPEWVVRAHKDSGKEDKRRKRRLEAARKAGSGPKP